MKNKKAWIAAGVIVAVIILIAAMGGRQEVEVTRAELGTFIQVIEDTGYVQAVNDHEIQAIQAARVSELKVEAGDQVNPGQLLMVLTSPELEAQIATARAQLSQTEVQLEGADWERQTLLAELDQAEDNLQKKKNLLEAGALSRSEYETAQLQLNRLKNQLSQQESNIAGLQKQLDSSQEVINSLISKSDELQVKSSAEGKLLDLPVKAGQVVVPGTRLAVIESGGGLEIKTELLSDEIRQVQRGQRVTITAPVLGDQKLVGQVSKIYPQAYEKVSALGVIQRRVPILISMEQTANLRPGYEVRVGIETIKKEKVILLPRESVRLNEKNQYRVLAVIDGRIKEVSIKIGNKNQQAVEVTEGIKAGDTVVRDGSLELKAGTRIKTTKP